MSQPKSIRWLINEYRGRGLFPYLFAICMVLALLIALLSTLATLTQNTPSEPWGLYSTPVYVGDLHDDVNTSIVSRDVAADGVPIVTDPTFPVVAVRCGPPEPLEVVSTRFWTIQTAPGLEGEMVDRIEGRRVPITLSPADNETNCQIITTMLTIPPEIASVAAGFTVRFRADIVAVNQAYRPVTVTSEQFYYRPDGPDPSLGAISTGRITLETP